MKRSTIYLSLLLLLLVGSVRAYAQDKISQDTLNVAAENKDDRNIMLNAASANQGPREVNIGLPASVGGTAVLENGLPVVYISWPEMPYKTWRMDAMTERMELYDLGQSAIRTGDVGFSVSTYDNLGTDVFQGSVSLNSNHFGLLNGTGNISGPLSKGGLKYSIGAFVNYDPGTYRANGNDVDRYYADQTQLYKIALTQDYRFNRGSGSVSLLYKYADSKTIGSNSYAPYVYHLDGSVTELDNFKIGRDNYLSGQQFTVQDAETGEIVMRDILKDFGASSHTLDILGKNHFDNGLNINYALRYHSARSGHYVPTMTGINEAGIIQNIMALGSRKTPIKTFAGLFEISKKSSKHEWKAGINQWWYNIDKFITEGVRYTQTVESDPQYIENSSNYGIYEYHNGSEYKTALFLTDKWDVSQMVSLTGGIRLEYLSLRGDYIDNRDNPNDNSPFMSRKRTDIEKDWLNKAFMLNGVFKVTKTFGFLAEMTYNEQTGHLEGYSAGNDPNLKRSKIPGGGIGVYYNHPLFSIVSKATYIERDEYRATVNFNNSDGEVNRSAVSYDIQTMGWTTDVVTNPFKNFNLHLLLTLQAPKYKNYSGTVGFGNGESIDYDFSGNTVSGVSKMLIEIDPSYQWKKLRIWGSARYFSKTYANLTNSLFFKGRWETFAGINYSPLKNLDFLVTVVNLLNQRGARGTISGADLYTGEEARNMEGRILAGTYIRPFTVEFGLKYKF